MTSDWWLTLIVVAVYALSWVMLLETTRRKRRLNQPKRLEDARSRGINAGYRNVEDWLRQALVTPNEYREFFQVDNEGACSRCGTYGPYDDVSAVYHSMQMCYWCAELERERTRLIVEPK